MTFIVEVASDFSSCISVFSKKKSFVTLPSPCCWCLEVRIRASAFCFLIYFCPELPLWWSSVAVGAWVWFPIHLESVFSSESWNPGKPGQLPLSEACWKTMNELIIQIKHLLTAT